MLIYSKCYWMERLKGQYIFVEVKDGAVLWYDELFGGYHSDVRQIIPWLPKVLNVIIKRYNR